MRRLAMILILAGLLLSLGGCHSQQTKTEPSPAAASTRQEPVVPQTAAAQPELNTDARPRIVCFGDSLTAGYGTDPGQAYPDYLQTELDRLGYRYRVINAGVSGNTTKDGVERVERVVKLNPALVVVEFGGNDGLRGLRIADTRANLDKVLSTLASNHIPVVIAGITLPPDYGPDYIRQFNDTYSLLAGKYHVPMLPFLLQGVFGKPGMMQPDRTHATAEGNRIVAQNVLGLIRPMLKRS